MRRTYWVLLASSLWGLVQACGGADTILGDGGPNDATVDVTPSNDSGGQDVVQQGDGATGDGGTTTGDATASDGATDGGTTTDGGGLAFRCGTSTVTDCSQCPNATQPCVYCGFLDASVLRGVCTTLHQGCQNTIPQGFQDCPCPQDPSGCPEAYQVCSNSGGGRCHTCSDDNNNDGLTCQNGGTCDAVDGGCL